MIESQKMETYEPSSLIEYLKIVYGCVPRISPFADPPKSMVGPSCVIGHWY